MSGGDDQNALYREIDTNFGHGGLTITVPNHVFLPVGKRMDRQNIVINYVGPDCVGVFAWSFLFCLQAS